MAIRSFIHKGLTELFETGESPGVRQDLVRRIQRRLTALHQARHLGELQAHGFNFHMLRGKPQRYSLHVNGPWCLTFEWSGVDACRVDLVQYH